MTSNFFPSAVHLFLKGVAVSFSGIILLGIINYLIRRHLALTLSRVDFGFFYSMFAFYGLLTTCCQFGIKQAGAILTASYIAKHQERRIGLLLSVLIELTLCSGIVVMLFLIFGRSFLAESFFKYPTVSAAIAIFSPYIVITSVWNIFLSVPHGKMEFAVYNGISVFQMLLVFLGVLSCAKRGILFLTVAWCMALFISMLTTICLVCSRYRLFLSWKAVCCIPLWRKIRSLCGWISVSSSGIVLLSYLDSICLTWLSDLQQVAAYNIALPVMQILQSLMVLPLVFLPLATKMWEERKLHDLKIILIAVNAGLTICTVPLVILIHYFGPWIITIMFGRQFLSSAPALTLLSAGILFSVAGQFNINFLNSSGCPQKGMIAVIVVFLANLTLNFFFIPRYGFYAAAFSLSTANFCFAVLTALFAFNHLRGKDWKGKSLMIH